MRNDPWSDEIRVWPSELRGKAQEDAAYYTNDREDALGTARQMRADMTRFANKVSR